MQYQYFNITNESKQLLTNDINNLFLRDKYGSSLYAMNNLRTISFAQKYRKQFKLLTKLLFLPIDLINIITEYSRTNIHLDYTISHFRSNTTSIFTCLNIKTKSFRCQLNLYVQRSLDCNANILNVTTSIFDELITNYTKNHYYAIHDYLHFFNSYMKHQYGINNFIKYYQSDCACETNLQYIQHTNNVYKGSFICNKTNEVTRVIRNHTKLYSIISILNIMINMTTDIIKKKIDKS